MSLNLDQTRAPKHIGDFGEGLVTYALVRKGFEVAKVDHVGADLIAEYDFKRFAVSVKTRYYRPGSVETRAVLLSHSDIKKLDHFAKQFGLVPLFAHVCSIADEKVIHLVIFPVSEAAQIMSLGQDGFRKDIRLLIEDNRVDYSCWKDEQIGKRTFFEAF